MTVTVDDLPAIHERFDEFIQPTNWPLLTRDPDLPAEFDPSKCWLWRGSLADGYGRFYLDGRLEGAHRVAYWRWNGPIPAGMQVDHLCFHRSCVNPDHLEAVTPKENVRRARAFPKSERKAWMAVRPYRTTPEQWRAYRDWRDCEELAESAVCLLQRPTMPEAFDA